MGDFPATSVLVDLPLKEGHARVILWLVGTTGNGRMVTSAAVEDDVLRTLIDLERDNVKWMRGETCFGHATSPLASNQPRQKGHGVRFELERRHSLLPRVR